MLPIPVRLGALLLLMGCGFSGFAQPASGAGNVVVPPLVKFSGVLSEANGKALTGIVGVTFSLYKDSQGGAPLWVETQNVKLDFAGHYTVSLGSTTTQGLPASLFVSGEARWLGIQPQGQAEQPRVLLMSVPYALKAGDAETVGGLPPSAFLLAAPAGSGSQSSPNNPADTSGNLGGPKVDSGTQNFIPLWTDNNGTLGNSALFQAGTAAKPKIGIGTTTPSSTLDVKGGGTIRGLLNLPATGTATSSAGKNSQPLDWATSAFNSGTSTAVPQTFQWQAEPVGNNTNNPSGSLNLLFGQGTGKPAETGLNIASNGQITFAKGQLFPGTIVSLTATAPLIATVDSSGDASLELNGCTTGQILEWTGTPLAWNCTTPALGTVTSVAMAAPGSDFTVSGSPITKSGTLTLGWNVAPTNANTGYAIVKRDASGNFSAGTVTATSFSGSGTGVTNVNATQLGGLGSGAFAQLAAANTFNNSQSILGNLVVGAGNTSLSTQTFGKDAGGGGIQNVTTNASTSGNSFAVFAATSRAGVTAELVADGLGTGAMRLVGGYLGTYTNQPMGFITNNTERLHIDTLGNIGIGTQSPTAKLETDAPSNSGEAAISARGGSSNSVAGDGMDITGGLNNASVGSGGDGIFATGGLETYPDQNYSTNGGEGIAAIGGQALGDFSYGGDGGLFAGGESPAFGGTGIIAAGGIGSGGTRGRAGYFLGTVEIQKDLYVDGSIFATNKDFRIDHPLAPADKFLYHASVESSEMMNIYTGNVTTDSQGDALVELPGWFEALNGDFRYQLTVIGQFAQAMVARGISNNQFMIRTDKPNVKVSWQVTGVRHDAAAKAHPLQVEVDKSARERGHYIHPALYGAPEEKGLEWAGDRQLMKRIEAARQKQLAQHQAQRQP